jgi:hypothetical protein
MLAALERRGANRISKRALAWTDESPAPDASGPSACRSLSNVTLPLRMTETSRRTLLLIQLFLLVHPRTSLANPIR